MVDRQASCVQLWAVGAGYWLGLCLFCMESQIKMYKEYEYNMSFILFFGMFLFQ